MMGRTGRASVFALVMSSLAALSLSGCVEGGFKAQSVKSSVYKKQPKRILVVDNLGRIFAESLVLRDRSGEFNERMVHIFAACGIQADYIGPGPLAIEDPVQAKIKSFHPDAVLSILLLSEGGHGIEYASYQAKLTDAATNAGIWTAAVSYKAGLTGAAMDVVGSLSKALIDHMKADGIIPASCSAG